MVGKNLADPIMALNGRQEVGMAVRRVVANIATDRMEVAKSLYGDVLSMSLGIDHGWIITFVGTGQSAPQISFAMEDGDRTRVPDLSIEVDDLALAHERVFGAGHRVKYGLTDETWGGRRFFVRDPFGYLLNILTHEQRHPDR